MSNIVIPDKMMAVVTTGNGGYEKLDYRSVDVPILQKGQVLLRVLAAGMNNTEINTRLVVFIICIIFNRCIRV